MAWFKAQLVDRTARLASVFADCNVLGSGAVPESVAILVRGALKSMILSRLKVATAAIASMTGIAIGFGIVAQGLLAQAEPVRVAAGAASQVAKRGSDAEELFGTVDLVRSVAFSRDRKSLIAAIAHRMTPRNRARSGSGMPAA